jgi:hypothetical protein
VVFVGAFVAWYRSRTRTMAEPMRTFAEPLSSPRRQ